MEKNDIVPSLSLREREEKESLHLGGTCCSCSLTSRTKVPKDMPQLKSMQVMPKGHPRHATAKGRARMPAPTIEVKLCYSFFFPGFSKF